jgi:hypothetical protein
MSNINDNLLDPICNTGLLNTALFPVGTAQHLDYKYNILPFLCDLLKATTNDNASPLLTNPASAFDISPYTDFSGLTSVGDPRVSLGDVMTQTFIAFLPKIITQTEVRQAGGTQVVDNYICTADGTPIKSSITGYKMLSIDLTGQKSYKYGAITIPPLSATLDQLMEPIQPTDVIDFIKKYMTGAKNESAQSFAQFIQTYFLNIPNPWVIDAINVYPRQSYLIVKLIRHDNLDALVTYIKYYADVANSVGCFLSQENLNYFYKVNPTSDMAYSRSAASIIPDYMGIINDSNAANQFVQMILSDYSIRQSQIIDPTNNIFNPDGSISTAYISTMFSQISSMMNSNYNSYSTTVSVSAISAVQCY